VSLDIFLVVSDDNVLNMIVEQHSIAAAQEHYEEYTTAEH